ncbi:MAG: GAF domain-containing protein [Ktedonobacteraceae bacterium]|nr:GAF domain-containing protein [Chloroflexota bacterium]
MKQLAVDASIDLTNCEREPIHIPGSIQPHGVLFVLAEPAFTIVQVSENVADFFGRAAPTVINQGVEMILGQENTANLREAAQRDLHAVNILAFHLHSGEEVQRFEGLLHRIEGLLILELEPLHNDAPMASLELYTRIMQTTARLQKAVNLRELCQIGCEEIYTFSGFDHVMLYQFDEKWNGTVIAEAKRAGIESFLGLRFPASDIPSQARQLYLKNWLRVIADVNYQPSALIPATNPITETPLDMSYCALRSVSPLHIEYMKNMGVVATLTISLIAGETLWGLLVCHHQTPIYPSHTTQYACELVGQILSSFISGKEEYDHFMYDWKIKTMQGSLLGNLPKEENLVEGLVKYGKSMLELVNAKGLAINIMDRYVTLGGVHRCVKVGLCPDEAAIQALVEWLSEQMVGDVLVTDALPEVYEPARQFKNVASGLLAISLSSDKTNYLLWFRPEAIQTTTWGGDPTKSVVLDDKEGMRLHPRKSFEAWKETIHMTSLAWQESERDAAAALRSVLMDMVTRDRIIKQRLRAWLHHD